MYNVIMAIKPDSSPDNLGTLILAVIEYEPLHGYAIAKRIKERSEDAFAFGEGTLYPALKNLLAKDWVVAKWDEEGSGPPRKVYSLTEQGAVQLAKQREAWTAYSRNISLVLIGGQSA